MGLIVKGDIASATKSGRREGSTTEDAMSSEMDEAQVPLQEGDGKVEKKDERGGRTKARAVLYHLLVEGIDFAYTVDVEGNVIVHSVSLQIQV
jgi:hypothetical protein